MNLKRQSLIATVAVVVSGCVDGGNKTASSDNESDTNRTDTEIQNDGPLNGSEYGGVILLHGR